MRKKLLLIYNPVAGKGEASRKIAPMIESFSGAGYEVTVQPVLPGHSTSQILKEAEGVYSRIVCCGGDGTLNHLVNALMQMETPPPYGYLPTGSTNDFARSMELPRRTKESCTAMLTGKPFCYDVGKFNDRYFNYVAAFGAFTNVSYLTSQDEKNSLGYLAYVIEGLKRLPIGRKFVAHVECGDQSWDGEYFYVAVSNSTSVAGMQLGDTKSVQLDDGLFEVLLVKAPANMAEASTIGAKLFARDFDGELVRLEHTDHVKFTFKEETAWTLDGEFGGAQLEAEVTVIPRALRILRKAK